MFEKVCASHTLPMGGVRLFERNQHLRIAIFRRDSGLHAIDNTCPHAGADLHYGKIEKDDVLCPFHAWRFHIETGRCAVHHKFNLKKYGVKEAQGFIWVDPDTGKAAQ